MRKFALTLLVFIVIFAVSAGVCVAKTATPSATPSVTVTETPAPLPTPPPSLVEKSRETLGPMEKLLKEQKLGPVYLSPIKYAIRGAIDAGVPANTLVLLLLLPVAASVIAGARHLIGLRGFGIFLPAALSVVFIATGPIVGFALFIGIITITSLARILFKVTRVKLQYLPRMALTLWFVSIGVLGILFLAPLIKYSALASVSIFPVLILALLAEDFTRVQLGKSVNTAINLTSETIILALLSYLFLTLKPIQMFALLNPEALLILVGLFDFFIGKYAGLRLLEIWRFRKLLDK
jgi:hypothetical protein